MDLTPRTQPDTIADAATAEIDLAQPSDEVWEAVVGSPDSWLGEGSVIEPVVGGTVHVEDVITGTTREGVVRRVDDGRRLDLEWWTAGEPADATAVRIDVIPNRGGTRVIVTETVPRRLGGTATAAAELTWRGDLAWRAAMLGLHCSRIRGGRIAIRA